MLFVVDEKEEIKHNPIELQENSRKGMIKKIKADIEIDKIICELEGYNFKEYLEEIQTLVQSYYHA